MPSHRKTPEALKLKSVISNLEQIQPAYLEPVVFDKDQVWHDFYSAYGNLLRITDWHNLDGSIFSSATRNNKIKLLAQKSIVLKPTKAYFLCIDEGVQDLGASKNTISFAAPGCGILMSCGPDSMLCKMANIIKEKGIKELIVTSHEGCGAASLAACSKFGDLSRSQVAYFQNLVDLMADDFSRQVACSLCQKLSGCKVEFAHVHKLSRPAFHDAVGTIVSLVPELNSGLFEKKLKLPMFNISGFLMDEKQLTYNINLAHDIAVGSHGMAEHFDNENPFLVLIVVKDESQKQFMQDLMSTLPEDRMKYSIVSLD